MTYNRSLQGRFVAGKGTSLILQLMSLALAVAGYFLTSAEGTFSCSGFAATTLDGTLLFCLSLLCYIPVALVIGSFHLFERRNAWLPALFLWLVAISVFLHGNLLTAFSVLLVVIVVALLLNCQPEALLERLLYTIFAITGSAAFLLPQFVFLLLPLIVALFVLNVFSVKRMLAALLGFATPFWIVYGIVYVWPQADVLLTPFESGIQSLFAFRVAVANPCIVVVSVMELMVLLPAVAVFASSQVPSKPLLRRRMIFLMFLEFYLIPLSWFVNNDFELFYAWRLPLVAVMASYLFTVKQTKASNIYFIFINLFWLSAAVLCLCLSR